jgi:RNA polymerase sigma-70 factor, ECF subfamily
MVGRSRTGPTLRVVVSDEKRPPAAAPLAASLDDSEIVEACRRGDSSAAAALHARVRGIVDATIARLLGRKDSRSEDLAQIAFIEIARSLVRFRGDCSLDTWASRVTAHAIYKELRRRKTESRVFASPADDDSASMRDEGAAIEHRSALRRVRAHLASMDPLKAWTLVLHDVAGYDLKEIAEITGASVAAAQSRLVRGRADLQSRIAADSELSDLFAPEDDR